jgi:DNA-binding transcriptional ArsR family regulator
VVDDESADGSAGGLEPESELFAEAFFEGGAGVVERSVGCGRGRRGRRGRPVDGEIEGSGEAGPIDENFATLECGSVDLVKESLDRWKPFGYGNRMVTDKRRREAVFRAISDPTRREILGILRSGHQTVGGIAGNFRMSRPAISKHLRLLHAAGLVVTKKRGTASVCSLDARPLRVIDDWLHDYEMFWGESLKSLKKYMEEKQ